ncbi:indolepyruvate ferredoxin oxidoreductase family protein [bacterium]|nr:indolepyruvate ferredoxin oxidoreductase family protein [bacterium]
MEIKLEDKYKLEKGVRFLTGSQALVRIPIVQIRKDKKNNLNTASYISGYRGSPLGSYDQQILKNIDYLKDHNIHFQPGINEELAATSLWGTQQSNLRGEGKYDGVFGIWYGKGPGVDRAGDALKHVNLAGTSKYGGVLALMGDDHICESSTTSHQSEFAMIDAMIPFFNPGGVQEILDYGLYGIHLSRQSGCWIGIKCVHDNVSSGATVDLDENRFLIKNVSKEFYPEDGLNIRLNDTAQAKEHRLHYNKIKFVKEFCKVNELNQIIYDSSNSKVGIVSTGKSYLDTKLALEKIGIDKISAEEIGVRLLKIAMPWPLEESIVHKFSEGLEKIIVVEEKRSLIETQIKEILFNTNKKIKILGKLDEEKKDLFISSGALDPGEIAIKLFKNIKKYYPSDIAKKKVNFLDELIKQKRNLIDVKRIPYFCSGCPHNTSTKIPDNTRAITGISCAYLVQHMERNNEGFTQMGSEGASWVGESVFSNTDHVFQNMGDGTYIHSGILSIRHAVAAKTKMTFKILYNDAVALTGGQALDGLPTVSQMSRQLEAEGVKKIAIITDEPKKYKSSENFSKNSKVYDRKDIISVQINLSKINDTTAIIYDQTCAAEKRRRRKKSILPEPNKKIFINEQVCEGCGDCGIQSNCVSIVPVETEYGRKRQIDQSNCNKDYSCVDGFCPSFISVEGEVKIKKNYNNDLLKKINTDISEPVLPEINKSYGIMIAGIGGTGVVTIGAILATAAQIDGKGSGVLDMTGLAQKGGSVKSFLRIFKDPKEISTIRLSYGDTNLLMGFDLLVANDDEVLKTLDKKITKSIINSDEVMTGEFTRDKNFYLPFDEMKENLKRIIGENNTNFIPSNTIASKILGDSILSNMFIVGNAYQSGLLPIKAKAIEYAIKLNGVSVEENLNAFRLGRYSVNTKKEILDIIYDKNKIIKSNDEKYENRFAFLVSYQNKKYANKYKELVDYVKKCEEKIGNDKDFSNAVAINYFKLMAYKDEYEVARLYSNNDFINHINQTFEGNFKINFYLSPSFFSKKDKVTKNPLKTKFGPWLMTLFKIISKFKFLRGTFLDPFSYLLERKKERKLIKDYKDSILEIAKKLNKNNYNIAVDIASTPDQIRGFGHIKEKNIKVAENCLNNLINTFNESK